MIESNKVFFEEDDAIKTSEIYINNSNDILTLELTGTHIGAEIDIECKLSESSDDWVSLAVINMNELSVLSTSITTNGIYQLSISGIRYIRANLTAITSGSVTLYGIINRECA